MEQQQEFIKGLFVKPAKPDFVLAKLGIKVDAFIEYLQENKKADGYINIDILDYKGVPYAKLNDWKPTEQVFEKPEKPNFHTSPTDEFPEGIDMYNHPLNSPDEQKQYAQTLEDWDSIPDSKHLEDLSNIPF